jgi:hypothetical protein
MLHLCVPALNNFIPFAIRVVSQLHAPTVLPTEKEPQVLIGQEAKWALEPVRTLWRRETSTPAGNPTPASQPVARRDATDTGVIRMVCTPLHIYFSLEFCL